MLSDDGRYVAYVSNADNVAAHLGSGGGQIYVVDLLQAAPEDRVPVIASAVDALPDPIGADGGSSSPAISATGQFVAFDSSADAPAFFPGIDNADNAFRQEWQVDVETNTSVAFPDTSVGGNVGTGDRHVHTDDFGPWFGGAVELLDTYVDPGCTTTRSSGICASPFGYHANDPCTVQVTFAPVQDGNRLAELCVVRAVGFGCEVTTVLGGQALVPDAPGPIVLESLTTDGDQLNSAPRASVRSSPPTGGYVAFETERGLDPADQNGLDDVYVRDRFRGTTTLISTGAGLGQPQGQGGAESVAPTISGDGRFIAFESSANKVPEPDGEDDGGRLDVFLVDRGDPDANGNYVPAAATMSLISIQPDGTGLFDNAVDASISGDGTQVAFTVVGGEGDSDVFVWDRFGPSGPRTVDLGTFVPTTISDTFEPAISADGLHVAFVGSDGDHRGPGSAPSPATSSTCSIVTSTATGSATSRRPRPRGRGGDELELHPGRPVRWTPASTRCRDRQQRPGDLR